MELRQLGYVEAIASWGSFTRAAAEIHMAQPALSVAVGRLEAELGVRLFERTSRGATLTDAGTAFLAQAGRVERDLDALIEEMRQYAGGARGRLRLSAWYSVEPRLGDFLRDYHASHPLIDISIAELRAPEALDCLRSADLDLAMLLLRPELDLSGLEHEVMRTEPCVLVLPPNHPLAERKAIELAETSDLPMIATSPGMAQRRWLDQLFSGPGPRPRIAIETNEAAATIAFVSAGLGVAFLTATIVHQIDRAVSLVPVTDVDPFVLAVAWRSRPRSAAVLDAIALARSQPGADTHGSQLAPRQARLARAGAGALRGTISTRT